MNEFSTIKEWSEALASKKISAVEAVDFYLERIAAKNPVLNSYITVAPEQARAAALAIDDRRARGENLSALAGVPFGVKDTINVADIRSTGAARILDNYISPYTSTVVQKLQDAGAVVVGKHNCDAFGHGGTNENSMYGAALNPWDTGRVAGGSSGGSGVAVAADLCAFAIGEDTGGSIRAPASFCGVTGLKTGYGRTSRFGAMPMSSSLDTVGPITRTAADAALVMEIIAGHDYLDATTAQEPVPKYSEKILQSIKGKKIGVPKEYFVDTMNSGVNETIKTALQEFEKLGAHLVEVSLPHTEYAIATYYIVVPCEDSSNLARLDGMRYGMRAGAKDLETAYTHSRRDGFPAEVKRRIMLGTFALSHGYYDAYYLQAQKMRTLIRQDFEEAFQSVDIIAAPAAPEIAFKVGEKTSDPLSMYLADIFVIPASLAGIPALSVPCGFSENLPVGLQLIGPKNHEEIPLQFGHQFQLVTEWHKRHPNI